jgi:hypothetical protein
VLIYYVVMNIVSDQLDDMHLLIRFFDTNLVNVQMRTIFLCIILKRTVIDYFIYFFIIRSYDAQLPLETTDLVYSYSERACMAHTLTFVLTGFVCPTLNVPNAYLSTERVVFTTAVNVTCWPGYVIDNTTNSINTICNASGMWSTYPILCWSKA